MNDWQLERGDEVSWKERSIEREWTAEASTPSTSPGDPPSVMTGEKESRMTNIRIFILHCQTTVSSHSHCRRQTMYDGDGHGEGERKHGV